jgi:hypothetical protein
VGTSGDYGVPTVSQPNDAARVLAEPLATGSGPFGWNTFAGNGDQGVDRQPGLFPSPRCAKHAGPDGPGAHTRGSTWSAAVRMASNSWSLSYDRTRAASASGIHRSSSTSTLGVKDPDSAAITQ